MSCLELDDAKASDIAEPMMDDIMAGIARRDYALHTAHHSVNLQSTLASDAFLAVCDTREANWGLPGNRELVCVFRKKKSFTLVWNQHYDKVGGQVMAVTTIALKGGRYFVDFFLLH
jgi:hypothetical protein